MKHPTRFSAAALAGLLACAVNVKAQDQDPGDAPAEAADTPATGEPPPAPTDAPPPPPANADTASDGGTATTAPSTDGQWVYTSQYGWVWSPYDRAYTYVTPQADQAYAYVYTPAIGWSWLLAPWVLGFGPVPYWGFYGPTYFAWYAHPWFPHHHGFYRAGFRNAGYGVHYHGGGGYHVGYRAPAVRGVYRAPPAHGVYRAPPAHGVYRAPPARTYVAPRAPYRPAGFTAPPAGFRAAPNGGFHGGGFHGGGFHAAPSGGFHGGGFHGGGGHR